MGMIELASWKSLNRGIAYYQDHSVLSFEKTGKYTYEGKVQGTREEPYHVHIDIDHPRRSVCDCAFAQGRHVVCKHMIALYFTVFPKELERLWKEQEEWEEEAERLEEEHREELKDYVYGLSKAELRERLLDALMELENTYKGRYW